MAKRNLAQELNRIAKLAQSRNQISTAHQIEGLIRRLGAAYYFEVDPGGYGDVIPDQEYAEFDDKEEVVQYVAEHLYGEKAGYTAEQAAQNAEALDFSDARAALMEVGEFGDLSKPVLPPDTLTGNEDPVDSSFYKEIEVAPVKVKPIPGQRTKR